VRVLSDVSLQRFLLFLSLSLFLGTTLSSFHTIGTHLSDVVVQRIEAWAKEKGATPTGVTNKVSAMQKKKGSLPT